MFSLVGPDSADLLEQLGVDTAELQQSGDEPRRHVLLNFGGKPVVVAAGSGLASPGFTVIVDETAAGDLWAALSAKVHAASAAALPAASSCCAAASLSFSQVSLMFPHIFRARSLLVRSCGSGSVFSRCTRLTGNIGLLFLLHWLLLTVEQLLSSKRTSERHALYRRNWLATAGQTSSWS